MLVGHMARVKNLPWIAICGLTDTARRVYIGKKKMLDEGSSYDHADRGTVPRISGR